MEETRDIEHYYHVVTIKSRKWKVFHNIFRKILAENNFLVSLELQCIINKLYKTLFGTGHGCLLPGAALVPGHQQSMSSVLISYLKNHLTSIGNPIVDIRRSYNHLISTMGFPILARWHLFILNPALVYIETSGYDNRLNEDYLHRSKSIDNMSTETG